MGKNWIEGVVEQGERANTIQLSTFALGLSKGGSRDPMGFDRPSGDGAMGRLHGELTAVSATPAIPERLQRIYTLALDMQIGS